MHAYCAASLPSLLPSTLVFFMSAWWCFVLFKCFSFLSVLLTRLFMSRSPSDTTLRSCRMAACSQGWWFPLVLLIRPTCLTPFLCFTAAGAKEAAEAHRERGTGRKNFVVLAGHAFVDEMPSDHDDGTAEGALTDARGPHLWLHVRVLPPPPLFAVRSFLHLSDTAAASATPPPPSLSRCTGGGAQC